MPAKKKAATTTERRTSPATTARGAAVRRLIESYPEAWGEFLREEREKVGLTPENLRLSKIQQFAAKMHAEGVDPSVIRQTLDELGYKTKLAL